MHVQIHSQSIRIKVGLEGISGYQSPPLFREPQSYLFACWQQVLSLPVQQHLFSLQAMDVHFIFLRLLLNATKKQLEFSAGSLNCARAWGLEVWRRELSGLCWPLGGFLAVSLSHSCRHLLRSCLSEVFNWWSTGGGVKHGYKLWPGAVQSARGRWAYSDSGELVRCWCTQVDLQSPLLPHSAFCLRSQVISNLGFCPFFACSLLFM